MNTVIIVALCQLTRLACIGAALTLVLKDKGEWWWFLVAAVILGGVSMSTTKTDKGSADVIEH